MQRIGVLGGLGPQATMDFEARLHRAAQGLIPPQQNQGYPPLVTWYVRHSPIAPGADGALSADPRLLEAAARLGSLCDFLVMPSNTPHLFAADIERAGGKPLLSIIEVTVAEIHHRAPGRVGLLATGLTLRRRLYQDRLEALGIACQPVADAAMDEIDATIFRVMEGREVETDNPVTQAVADLRDAGCDAVLLGCTELPLVVPDVDSQADLVNPAQLLAEAAVRAALEDGLPGGA